MSFKNSQKQKKAIHKHVAIHIERDTDHQGYFISKWKLLSIQQAAHLSELNPEFFVCNLLFSLLLVSGVNSVCRPGLANCRDFKALAVRPWTKTDNLTELQIQIYIHNKVHSSILKYCIAHQKQLKSQAQIIQAS